MRTNIHPVNLFRRNNKGTTGKTFDIDNMSVHVVRFKCQHSSNCVICTTIQDTKESLPIHILIYGDCHIQKKISATPCFVFKL